jgi:adenylate kinase
MPDFKTVIFYGYSGSGKGTQAALLIKQLQERDPEHPVFSVSTGDGLRALQEEDTYTGRRIREVLDVGGLIPEFLPIFLWSKAMAEGLSENHHVVLDGLTRRIDEAPVLHHAFEFYKRGKPHVIVLDLPRDVAFQRLIERGRYDDKPDEINRRLDWYKTNVEPVIDYFRKHDEYFVVHDIDSDRDVNEVHEDILERIGMPQKKADV